MQLPLVQQGLPSFPPPQVSSRQTDAYAPLNRLPELLPGGQGGMPGVAGPGSSGPGIVPPAFGSPGSGGMSQTGGVPPSWPGYGQLISPSALPAGITPPAMAGSAGPPGLAPSAIPIPGLPSQLGQTTDPLPPSPIAGWQGVAPLAPPSALPGGPAPLTSRPTTRKAKSRKRKFPLWARVAAGIMLTILLLVGLAVGYYYYAFAGPLSGMVSQQVPRLAGDSGSDTSAATSGGSLPSGGRFNILLLGSDTDEKFNGHYLAQTDIVVTIDPATKSVGMLSIPRDFWLPIPGVGMGKLDEAYSYGLYNGPQGGVALARATIHADFGIPIDYYAWVGLDGFVKVIDTVGGVDVDLIHPITDDTYPDDVGNTSGDIHAYKRLYLAPGPQHLSGAEALEYVRSRHADLVGDFGRSARQQQVLTQLKTKLDNPSILGKLQEIAQDLNGYVKTDLSLTQVLQLTNFARSINTANIQRVTLGPPYSHAATVTRSGQAVDVEIPNCSLLQPLIAKMFDLGDKALCNVGTADSSSPGSTAAIATVKTQPQAALPPASGNALSTAGQMADLGLMSLEGQSSDNLLGLHSLLDLVFTVTFESLDAAKV
jgi:LCP family protein required for cell wall assembly